MSLGGLLASTDAAAEAAARRGVYAAAQERIAAIRAHEGHAATPGTKAAPPSAVGNALENSLSTLPLIGPFVQASGNVLHAGEAIGGEAGKALESASNLPGEAGGAIATPIAEGLVGLVKPIALKLTLYAVLILGGIALAGYGLATMLRPEPPKLKVPSLGKLAKDDPELALL